MALVWLGTSFIFLIAIRCLMAVLFESLLGTRFLWFFAIALLGVVAFVILLRPTDASFMYPPDPENTRYRASLQTWLFVGACIALGLTIGVFCNWRYEGTGILYDARIAAFCGGTYAVLAYLFWQTPAVSQGHAATIALAQGLSMALLNVTLAALSSGYSNYMSYVPPIADRLVFITFVGSAVGSVTLPFYWRLARLNRVNVALVLVVSIVCAAMWWCSVQLMMAQDRCLSFGID